MRTIEPKIWRSLLLLPLSVGCVTQVQHQSSSFSSTSKTTMQTAPGSQWPEAHRMLFRYQVLNGQAALANERVLLVFHGLSPEQQRLFHFQQEPQTVQVDGPGTSSVSTTCTHNRDQVAFISDYALGTNTLQFGEQTVLLTRGGWLLLAGQQSVDLSTGRKVIHVIKGNLSAE
jgi:hypothetical protein